MGESSDNLPTILRNLPIRLEGSEVKVTHYWLEVNAMTRPMKVCYLEVAGKD